MEKRIEALRLEFQLIAREIHRKANEEAHLDMRIVETFRTVERQAALQKSSSSDVILGYHQFGLAFDFACFTNGRLITRGDAPEYARVGAIAKTFGCKWPIRLRSGALDAGHVEYHPGFTLQQFLTVLGNGIVAPWSPPKD